MPIWLQNLKKVLNFLKNIEGRKNTEHMSRGNTYSKISRTGKQKERKSKL
jgi:hypothetical protein